MTGTSLFLCLFLNFSDLEPLGLNISVTICFYHPRVSYTSRFKEWCHWLSQWHIMLEKEFNITQDLLHHNPLWKKIPLSLLLVGSHNKLIFLSLNSFPGGQFDLSILWNFYVLWAVSIHHLLSSPFCLDSCSLEQKPSNLLFSVTLNSGLE